MEMEPKGMPRRGWFLCALLALLLCLGLLSLFLVPVPKPQGNTSHESLIRHPDKIFSLYGEMPLSLFKEAVGGTTESQLLVLQVLAILILGALPGLALYSLHRAIEWPRRIRGKKAHTIAILCYLLPLGGLSLWSATINPISQPLAHDSLDAFGKRHEQSADLDADLKAMWEVNPPEAGREWMTATNEAIWAAVRVFNTVDLKGLSLEEARKILHLHLRDERYGYQLPFWPTPENSYSLRFDNGAWGWQFDLILDEAGNILCVNREPIH